MKPITPTGIDISLFIDSSLRDFITPLLPQARFTPGRIYDGIVYCQRGPNHLFLHHSDSTCQMIISTYGTWLLAGRTFIFDLTDETLVETLGILDLSDNELEAYVTALSRT